MNKIFTGRLITVIIVTLLSLYFVWPTFKYFTFVSSEGEVETDEQRAHRQEMLDDASMIKFGLDLQGGVEFLFTIDREILIEREIDRVADSISDEFRINDVGGSVEVNLEDREILVSGITAADAKIAEDIILDQQSFVEWDTLDGLATSGDAILVYQQDRLNEMIREATNAAMKTIRERIDEFGLTQPLVTKQGSDRILVQIPGETNPQRIRNTLLRTANLEFRLLHENHDQEIRQFIQSGNESWIASAGTGIIKPEFLKEVPTPEIEGGTKLVIDETKVAGLVPAGYELFLGKDSHTTNEGEVVEVENLAYLLRDRVDVTGKNLRRASDYYDPSAISNQFKVTLEFDPEGTENFADITEANVGRRFAIVLDDVVFSAPTIQDPIRFGRCEITGNFTPEDARDLALVLKSGSLPAPLTIISDQQVGASLGRDSIKASGKALMIGAIALVIMMIWVYRMAGLFAVCAMLLNVLAILAVLSLADATLTLSGIGGILLTMGMAVDANVLIYERLREEFATGKPFRAALNSAFDRAFSVIIDSNTTTLLPALVLLSFEIVQESVRGFWMALAIGLIINLYTGLTVTRALIETYVAKRKNVDRNKFVGTWIPFKNAKFDFMKYRKIGFPLSGALIVLLVGYMVTTGVNAGIDFTGGVVSTVAVSDDDIGRADLERVFAAQYEDVKVISVINTDKFQITVPKTSPDQTIGEIRENVTAILAAEYPDSVTLEQSQGIESLVGEEFALGAFFTVLVASLVILGYIALRFRPVFGLGAVAALVHDVTISLGIFVLMGHSLTLDIVSALLIILGYSVNDTIVVFDRIRERMSEMYGHSMGEIINLAINQTLSRTVFTSGSTLLAILAMYLFGGVGLKDFSLILLIGIIVGTYSSIFIASALIYSYVTAREKRLGIEKAHGRTKTVKIGG